MRVPDYVKMNQVHWNLQKRLRTNISALEVLVTTSMVRFLDLLRHQVDLIAAHLRNFAQLRTMRYSKLQYQNGNVLKFCENMVRCGLGCCCQIQYIWNEEQEKCLKYPDPEQTFVDKRDFEDQVTLGTLCDFLTQAEIGGYFYLISLKTFKNSNLN